MPLYFCSDLSLLTFSYISLYYSYLDVGGFLIYLTSEYIRHLNLANLLSWLGVNLFIEKLFKQKLCVGYFTKMHSCFSRFDQLIKHTLCVS